ncbi:MAG TPA: short chain dehydrogenase [Bacillota bacterium]|nr:short chain dehydrogenase [Bacillota bacterium]
MKILIVGASGTIGTAVRNRLEMDHEIIQASRNGKDVSVDITSVHSIRNMFEQVGKVDAVISVAGGAEFASISDLTPELNEVGINSKLKGQINLVLIGKDYVNDGGSFTLTTGIMMDDPIPLGASSAMANGGVKAFVKAASMEMPRGIRINSVSPDLLKESLHKYGQYFRGFEGIPVDRVAYAYQKSVEGLQNGQHFEVYSLGQL